jgi:hypothetical protein
MAEITKEFPELAQKGLNYLMWASDYEIVLEGRCILRVIGLGIHPALTGHKVAPENAQAQHFLRHHLCPTLIDEYMAERSTSAFGPLSSSGTKGPLASRNTA